VTTLMTDVTDMTGPFGLVGVQPAGKMIWSKEQWGIDQNSGRDGGRYANDPLDRLHDYFASGCWHLGDDEQRL
jgi:hypothetical protein